MRSLRIVKVMPFFAPANCFGGSVSQAASLCRELARRGHQLRVVTSDLGIGPELRRGNWVERDGYVVHYAKARRWHAQTPYPPPPITLPLTEALAEADVLCLNVGLTLVNAKARRMALRAGVPYVYNAEGSLCPQRLRIKRLRKSLFVALVERRVLRDAAAIQALTAKDADDLCRLGADRSRVHVIPNGVESLDLDTGPDRAAFRATHDIADDATVVLFLGRLSPIKGIDLTLEAAAPLLGERDDVVLVVAGPDEGCREGLERRARELGVASALRFPGGLDPDGCLQAMRAADVFALTSYTEGLPMAALEAAAAGLPLWITDRCNLPEVAMDGAGEVAPPDIEPLAAGLRRLVCDVEHRRRCAENAVAMARMRFSLAEVATRLEALYRSVAGS